MAHYILLAGSSSAVTVGAPAVEVYLFSPMAAARLLSEIAQVCFLEYVCCYRQMGRRQYILIDSRFSSQHYNPLFEPSFTPSSEFYICFPAPCEIFLGPFLTIQAVAKLTYRKSQFISDDVTYLQ